MTQTAQGRAVYTTFIRNVSRPYLQNWRILSVKRMNHFWLAAGLAASQFLSQTANAGIEISVQPDPLAVAGSNTPFSVDIWVSGLNGAGSPPISSSSRGKPDRREVKVVAFVASGGARADPG
jgi:hypothetical protein